MKTLWTPVSLCLLLPLLAEAQYTGGQGRGDVMLAYTPVPKNNSCTSAKIIDVLPPPDCGNDPTLGTNTGASQWGGTPVCDGSAGTWPDVWYTFQTGDAAAVEVFADMFGATDLVVEVLAGGCNGTVVACGIVDLDVFPMYVPVEPATTMHLRVSSNLSFGQTGTFTVCVVQAPPPNDTCAAALPITVGAPGSCPAASVTGSTSLASPSASLPDCDQVGTPLDVWYAFDADDLEAIELHLDALTAEDLVVEVYEADCDGDVLACAIFGLNDLPLLVPVTPNTGYIVRVLTNEIFGSPGTFQLCINAAPGVSVLARAVLDGPYVPATGLMDDDLRQGAAIPTAHPFGDAPFFHTGTETADPGLLFADAGPNAIVDWVLLELRDALAPATVVASSAALLQRDGDLVAPDGSDPVLFPDVAPGSYHLVVRHRNHMGCMTLAPIALGFIPTGVDFTLASTATFGTGARKSIGGAFPVQALWSGDVNADGSIRYTGANNDRDPILSDIGGAVPTATLAGYHPTDVNMDGVVKYTGPANDRDFILQNIGGTVPTAVRVEQLP